MIKTLLEEASKQFSILSKTPRLDAELLLCHVLKKERLYLFSYPEKIVSDAEYQQWQMLVEKRLLQIPVAYLIGQKSFWNLELRVNEHTLIPRPETELLVEIVLEKFSVLKLDAAGRRDKWSAAGRRGNEVVTILDLGAGSGAIALALGKENPHWQITAVDFSYEALKIAKLNAEQNNINNVEFIQSDWFSALSSNQCWDLIVSNPPYLDENDPHLLNEEIRHEPRSALVAKKNGLSDIEKIMIEARSYLKPEGALLFEHGCAQGGAVRELFSLYGYQSVVTLTDLAGLERVTQAVVV